MSDQQPPNVQGQVSPDGNYVWNGTAWVPNTDGVAGAPAPGNPNAAAKAAKAYAKASRPWYKKKRWIGAIVLVAIIAIASASGGGSSDDDTKPLADSNSKSDDKTSDDKKSDAKKSDAKKSEKKPVITTAAAMIKEYEDNELGADQKYKGEIVQVTGIVDKIDTEPFDDSDYIVEIGGGGEFEFLLVRAWDLPNEIIATIKKGDKITVKCKFDDGGDLGVDIKHCELVK